MAVLSPYLCASISILTVMLICLISIILVCPLLNKSYSKHIISLLTMLAVGCLCGDAIFHLIPHSLGLDDRQNRAYINSTTTNTAETGNDGKEAIIVWKCSLVIASIYAFYLLNNLMNFSGLGHGHSHGHSHTAPPLRLPLGGEALKEDVDEYVQAKFRNIKNKEECENEAKENDCEAKENDGETEYQQLLLHFDSINPKAERSKTPDLRHIPRVVWMILIGGVLHNVTDGLAVGASFAGSISGGISTTLAILFHEIPHEIGDFVILLKSGISPKCAMLITAFTYVASLIGGFTGVALGKELDIVEWIFAATAGMFLYIALVELLPDTIDVTEESASKRKITFLWQNIGFLLGTLIMALIALYEDKIKTILKSY